VYDKGLLFRSSNFDTGGSFMILFLESMINGVNIVSGCHSVEGRMMGRNALADSIEMQFPSGWVERQPRPRIIEIALLSADLDAFQFTHRSWRWPQVLEPSNNLDQTNTKG